MEWVRQDMERRLFPLALEKLEEHIEVLKSGLESGASLTASEPYAAARELLGEVFIRSHAGNGRMYYMWRGEADPTVFPDEITVWLEDHERSLIGTLFARIVVPNPEMMRWVMVSLFTRFPAVFLPEIAERQKVWVEEEWVYSPYLG